MELRERFDLEVDSGPQMAPVADLLATGHRSRVRRRVWTGLATAAVVAVAGVGLGVALSGEGGNKRSDDLITTRVEQGGCTAAPFFNIRWQSAGPGQACTYPGWRVKRVIDNPVPDRRSVAFRVTGEEGWDENVLLVWGDANLPEDWAHPVSSIHGGNLQAFVDRQLAAREAGTGAWQLEPGAALPECSGDPAPTTRRPVRVVGGADPQVCVMPGWRVVDRIDHALGGWDLATGLAVANADGVMLQVQVDRRAPGDRVRVSESSDMSGSTLTEILSTEGGEYVLVPGPGLKARGVR